MASKEEIMHTMDSLYNAKEHISDLAYKSVMDILMKAYNNAPQLTKTDVYRACKKDNLQQLERYWQTNKELFHLDNCVNACCENVSLNCLRFLISKGASINNNFNYCLAWACIKGSIPLTSFLIENGVKLNNYIYIKYRGDLKPFKAIMLATMHCRLELVKFLLRNGAVVEIYEYDWVRERHLQILKLLCRYGLEIKMNWWFRLTHTSETVNLLKKLQPIDSELVIFNEIDFCGNHSEQIDSFEIENAEEESVV